MILAALEWLIILGGAIALGLGPHSLGGDGQIRFQAIWTLLIEHRTSPEIPYSFVGMLPALAVSGCAPDEATAIAWVSRCNFIVAGVGLCLLFFRLRRLLCPVIARRFVLLAIFASMLASHQRYAYGEVYAATLSAVGLSLGVGAGGIIGWVIAGLGSAGTPACVPALALTAVFVGWRRRSFWPLVGPILAGILVVGENQWRRGNPFVTGYEANQGSAIPPPFLLPYSGEPGFSYPPILGIYSLLFSSGKGLLFFAPGLAWSLWWINRPDLPPAVRRILTAWLIYLAGMILTYSAWWSWYGGLFWGPRFLLFAIFPATLGLALSLGRDSASLLARSALLGATALSFWVGVNGWVFEQQLFEADIRQRRVLEFFAWYVPEYSPLWRPWLNQPTKLMCPPWKLQQKLAVAGWAVAFLILAGADLRGGWRKLMADCWRRDPDDGRRRTDLPDPNRQRGGELGG